MTPNTDWTGVPHTRKSAKPSLTKMVRNTRVVKLEKAFIRGSEVSGTFLLAENAAIKPYAGRQRIEVQCLWFGRKPPTTWMNITLRSKPTFDDNFSGDVVWNIDN